MRNLKKILALVLALVMSLSLMAVAGAKDFTDKADINADYQAAVDVLNGLEVFRGYENGSFQPKGDITRAEVATIIYRIATADVKDAQAGIYTTWGKFADVKDTDWYAGYVNYCANANIVKGKTPAGVTPALFDPNARITGYQVLAMILRTIGYGKNGEFEGANWAINTAAQAKALGIIDGVTENLLGSNATREFVAQMLFKTILTDMVDYSVLEGYKSSGKNLAKEKFGMDRISGIVVANEYADLRDDSPVSKGTTVLRIPDGDKTKDVTMNISTGRDDLGESRYAYVRSDGKRSNDLVTGVLYNTGRNVTKEQGDATKVTSLAGEVGLTVGSGAKYFVNFGEDAEYLSSEYQISYLFTTVAYEMEATKTQADFEKYLKNSYGIIVDPRNNVDPGPITNGVRTWTWKIGTEPASNRRVSIAPYTHMTAMNLRCIQDIFYYAGLEKGDAANKDVVLGEVYVGTQYRTDVSDELSHKKFLETYLEPDVEAQNFKNNANGEWMKVIDNNNDGLVDYVFKNRYVLDEITGYNSRSDYYRFANNGIDVSGDYSANYGSYEPAIGDVVLGTLIDGVWHIELAPMETKTIQTINFKEKFVVTTEGDTWVESGITNATDYADAILEMNQKTEYEIFFDDFGHIRAYRAVKGSSDYALLTELYGGRQNHNNIITKYNTTVEITIQDDDTVEMPVSNVNKDGSSVFKGVLLDNDSALQRAINHLATSNSINHSDPDKRGWNDKDVSETTALKGDEFKWDGDVSVTNVAAYKLADDGKSVALDTAAAFMYDRQGRQLFYSNLSAKGTELFGMAQNTTRVNEADYRAYHALAKENGTLGTVDKDATTAFRALKPVYAVDYVQLDGAAGLKKGAVRYEIHEDDCSHNLYDTLNGYDKYDGNYVNATHNTQYYLVTVDGGYAVDVEYFTDYANVPAINAGQIKAMYAVARNNSTTDAEERDYWIADVIVIETEGVATKYDSVALTYYSPETTSGGIHWVKALNNMTSNPDIDLNLTNKWYYSSFNPQWQGYGFYELFDTEVAEPDVDTDNIVKIPTKAATDKGETDYNAHGINAALVTRTDGLKDNYIMIDRTGYQHTKDHEEKLDVADSVKVYGIYHNGEDDEAIPHPEYVLEEIDLNDLEDGDRIIYVNDKAGSLRYIVITNYVSGGTHDFTDDDECSDATWLGIEYRAIIEEQIPEPDKRTDRTLVFDLKAGEKAVITCLDGEEQVVTVPDKNGKLDATIWVNDLNHFTFYVKGDVSALVPVDGFTFNKTPVTGSTTGEWRVTAVNTTLMQTNSARAGGILGKAYSTKAIEAIIKQVADMNIGAVGAAAPDFELAKNLAKELAGIAANTLGAVETTDGAKLDAVIVPVVVDVKVAEYFEQHPELDYASNVDAVKAAVTEAVEGAIAGAESVSENEIDKIVKEKVDEAVAEVVKPATVDVTLKTEDGIGVKSAADKNGNVAVTDSGDNVYTLTADTELTVVLTITSEEELDETNPVIVTVDGKPADDAKATLVDTKTVTVALKLPANATKVTYEFALNTKEDVTP